MLVKGAIGKQIGQNKRSSWLPLMCDKKQGSPILKYLLYSLKQCFGEIRCNVYSNDWSWFWLQQLLHFVKRYLLVLIFAFTEHIKMFSQMEWHTSPKLSPIFAHNIQNYSLFPCSVLNNIRYPFSISTHQFLKSDKRPLSQLLLICNCFQTWYLQTQIFFLVVIAR